MKKLSFVLSMLVLGLAGNAMAQFEPFPGGQFELPNVICEEQFGKVPGVQTYLVVLGNTGLVIDSPAADPFDDVCVYFPNSEECKNRPPRPTPPKKTAVRLVLNVEKVTTVGRGTQATGTTTTRTLDSRAGRFQLNLEYGQSGYAAKLATGSAVRFFNCRQANSNVNGVLQ